MKLYCITTILMFLCSSASAAKIDLESVDLGRLAVRVLLNRGRPSVDGAFCSSEDEVLLQTSLNQVLPFTRRNLRASGEHGRELVNCRRVCQGFPPGQCYIVYSDCVGYRRELTEEEEDESNTDEDAPRFLQRNMQDMAKAEAIENKCSGMMKRVEDQLVAIIDTIDDDLSLSCSTLVRKKMRVECELMTDDE